MLSTSIVVMTIVVTIISIITLHRVPRVHRLDTAEISPTKTDIRDQLVKSQRLKSTKTNRMLYVINDIYICIYIYIPPFKGGVR